MNEQQILLAFGGIGAAALGCQWLAWRLKLPAILFLLLTGILAGPVLGWLDPQEMFGPLLMPLVSLAVALILFEGSLTLHLSQWREIGSVVRRLVTLGALSTWLVIAVATHWLLGFDWLLAILFGTLTLVTGPTVIVPMLRVVRPKASIANILRWEGIVIDPIGALLAVVVYSFIIASADGNGLKDSLLTFGGVIVCGGLFGIGGGYALGTLIRRQWLPEYLHNLASLAAVLGIFIAANQTIHESGLLAVTLMGMWLANMKGVDVTTQGLLFKSVNMRGFGATGNPRIVQMIDGMDNQAPGLNFAVDNIVGMPELDVESVEVLPGAASALYGPNAINGLILMNSKSPFLYQGLSATIKSGIMNSSNRTNADGSALGITPFNDVAIRYAKAVNDKFAYKVNVSYLAAQDWQANIQRIEKILTEQLTDLAQLEHVADVRVLGAIGVVELITNVDMKTLQQQFVERGIWVRPFGKLVYVMPPYVITDDELHYLLAQMSEVVKNMQQGANSNVLA